MSLSCDCIKLNLNFQQTPNMKCSKSQKSEIPRFFKVNDSHVGESPIRERRVPAPCPTGTPYYWIRPNRDWTSISVDCTISVEYAVWVECTFGRRSNTRTMAYWTVIECSNVWFCFKNVLFCFNLDNWMFFEVVFFRIIIWQGLPEVSSEVLVLFLISMWW